MTLSSILKHAAAATALGALVAGCSNGSQMAPNAGPVGVDSVVHMNGHHVKPQWSYPASIVPKSMIPIHAMALRGRPVPDAIKIRGIYVSEFSGTSIFGYQKGNRANNPAFCTSPFAVSAPNGIAVDGMGNLMDPDGGSHSIIIGQGPNMCGAEATAIADPFGQPSDASSADALNGTIAVGNIFDNSGGAGSISLCTVSAGCTTNLTNPAMFEVAGVAMDNSGNCWADATDPSGFATLTYFAGCTGSGQQATGFLNGSFGGIDIDASGNLVTIDAFTPAVYVYSGCNPNCTLVGGPFSLIGDAVFGHLNSKFNNKLATGDFVNGQIDIYRYTPTSLTYAYSFNNGLSASLDVEGAAYNKRSPQ